MAQSSGFDVSKMSTASKILLGGGILLLIDSFLPWERVCAEFAGVDLGCVGSFTMWGGSASFLGIIAGLLLLALIIWEGLALANVALEVGIDRSKLSAYLGFGVLAFVVLKFLFVITDAGVGAWIGLVLALAIGYGAWMRFQEPVAAPPPPPAANDGTTT